MPFKLFYGDSIDDTTPWCPVCFDLKYENFATSGDKQHKADPARIQKGTLAGFTLWWRGRPDFQQRAERHKCVYCALLLQIVDRFCKKEDPRSSQGIHRQLAYELNVFENGSVEVKTMRDFPRRPLGLLLYTPSGCSPAWGRLPCALPVSPWAGSKQALQFLRTQLEECCQEHEDCHFDNPVLPTRVLDVGSLEAKKYVRVVQPTPGTPGKYIALSYCWGDGNGLQANQSNLAELLEGIDEDELPASIQDAVELTRCLGVQYLWVDALCIVQDDTKDWVHESARMSDVYAQALLTISASSVSSSRYSFLHQSRGNKEVLFHWRSPETSKSVDITGNSTDDPATPGGILAVRKATLSGFHQDHYDDIIDPTMTRAWTLQEHTLSARLICFSTDELQWTCRTLRACECGNPEGLESPRLEQLRQDLRMAETRETSESAENLEKRELDWPSEFFHFWARVVEAYCRRALTCGRDKLPALSGIAHEFSKTFAEARSTVMTGTPQPRYLAGLWSFEFHLMLLWWSHNDVIHDGSFAKYRAPTWSWASVDGTVNMRTYPTLRPPVLQAEVLDAGCALANSDDPFGQVVQDGTYLRLRALVIETQLWFYRPRPGWGVENMTPYGRVAVDCFVEDVPVDGVVWGESSAAAAAAAATSGPVNDDEAVMSDPVQARTLQRLRPKSERSLHAAHKKKMTLVSGSESDSESNDESDSGRYSRHTWEESNLGRKFTVWLLHVADYAFDGPYHRQPEQFLVLGRPEGDEQVYERLGYMNIDFPSRDKWVHDVSGRAKSIVTIV